MTICFFVHLQKRHSPMDRWTPRTSVTLQPAVGGEGVKHPITIVGVNPCYFGVQGLHVGVSINWGTPKWMVYKGKSN